MNEDMDDNKPAVPDQLDADIVSMLMSMQQQLVLLEKKVDLLLTRQQGKPFDERGSHSRPYGKRTFSRQQPARTYDNAHRHDRRERERPSRDMEPVRGHFYEQRPQEKGRRSNAGKKPFTHKRKDRE